MTVNVYKSWTGRDFDTLELQEGSAIKDCVSGVDWNNAVILCNGNRVNENYVLKDTDVVAIRGTPSVEFAIAVGILIVAFGAAELVSYATTGKELFTNIRDWLMPDVSSNSNKEQSQLETLPTLKGARNQNISGKAVPFIVGQTRISPYKVGTGYHSVSGTDGETQRYHQLYVIGYNDIRCGMFKFGETDFAYNGMSESYDRFDGYRLEIGEGKKNGSITDFEQKSPFANASPELSIADKGEVSGFSVKVTEEGIGKQIINADGSKLKFTRASDRYPRKVEVEIAFNGLLSFDDEGNEKNASAEICFGYSIDGGKTFNPFSGQKPGSHYESVEVDDDDKAAGIKGKLLKTKITRKKNKTMRFVANHTFSYEDFNIIENSGNGYVWIRVERADPDSTDIKTSNKAYLAYIRTWVYDKEKSAAKGMAVSQSPIIEKLRDRTTRCGISINATENVADELAELNCMAVAECRTWNSSSGKWSGSKSPTDNPAANALNVMQSGMLGDFAYPDKKIDLDEFGRLHEFCAEKKFSVGTALTSRKKLSEVVDSILIQARAYRIVSGQKYSVFIDRPVSTPACVLNNSNILKDGAANSKEFKPLPDGFRIKFVNKNIGYDEDEVYVMFSSGVSYDDPTAVIESLEMPFVTDPKQVAKNAWFEYGKRKLRPELWKRPVTTEANVIEIGSRVELQDDTIRVGIGNGGWITKVYSKDGMVTGFRISSKINISDMGKSYGAKITHSTDNSLPDIMVRKLKVKEAAYSDDFELETPVLATDASAPALGDLVSIGEYGKETISAICLGKKDNGNGRFELSLVPYSAALYSMDSGAKVEFDSKVSSVQKPAIADMREYVGKTEMLDAISKIVNGIDTDTEPPDTPIVSECRAYRDYVSMKFDALPESDRNTLRNVEWQVNKTGLAWEDFHSNLSFSARYDFDRGTDGYPEREDLDWQFRCRVTNTRGIASDWSAPIAADTSGYGTWRVSSVKDAYAKTDGSDSMRLRFDGGRPSARQYYGSTRFTVTVKYDGKPVRTEADVPYSLYYHFDRETDGYPERHVNAADGIRDLSLYSFTIRPVESVTGETGEDVTVSVDDSSYGTWLIPPMETSAEAGEHLVTLQWGLDGATPYGKTLYDVYLGGEPLKEGMSASYYVYRFAENLSAEEAAALGFSVRARNEAHERTAEFSVDTSGYLGYKVEKPWIRAAARKEGIDVSWDRTNEFYGKCEFVLLKDGEEIFRSAREREFFLPFGEGEFPEKDDILAISLTVRIEGDADSATSDPAETDVSGYLTWTPQVPKVYPSASGRNASLSWDAQDGVYGFTGCEVQIAKAYKVSDGKMVPVTDVEELEWFAPALGLNPYESLENYKRGDAGGRLEVGGLSVSLTLPLFGQDGGGASDTPYAFRLRGKSAAGKVSGWTEALFVTCRAVSAYDVTKAWDLDDKGERVKVDGALGAAQIFVEELSAIAANLGFITDGALKGNAYNYWAVGDVRSDDGSMLWRGSFRVGGKEQYILVEPRIKDGTPTGEYDITFVVGNFSVSATGTQMRGGAFEVFDDDGNLVFRAAPEGTKAIVSRKEFISKGMSVVPLKQAKEYYGNYCVTFDPFDYKGAKCAVSFAIEYNTVTGSQDFYFQLATPEGTSRLRYDFDLENIGLENLFYSTETHVDGDTVRTAFFDFDLAARAVVPSEYMQFLTGKREAGESLDIGAREFIVTSPNIGYGGMAFAAGKYFTASTLGDTDDEHGNFGIYAAADLRSTWTLALPLDRKDGIYVNLYALGGRVVAWQDKKSYTKDNGVFHISSDGVKWTTVRTEDSLSNHERKDKMWFFEGVYFANFSDGLYGSSDLIHWTKCSAHISYIMAFDGQRFLFTSNYNLYAAQKDSPSDFVKVMSGDTISIYYSNRFFEYVYVANGKIVCVGTDGIAYTAVGSDLSDESSWTKISKSFSYVYGGVTHDGSIYFYATKNDYYLVRVDLATMEVTTLLSQFFESYLNRADNGMFFGENRYGTTPALELLAPDFVYSCRKFVSYGSLFPVFEDGSNKAYLSFFEESDDQKIFVLDENFDKRCSVSLGANPISFITVDGFVYMLFQTAFFIVLVRVSLSRFAAEACVIAAAIDDSNEILSESGLIQFSSISDRDGRVILPPLPLKVLTDISSATYVQVSGHLVVSDLDAAWTPLGNDGSFDGEVAFASARLHLTDGFTADMIELGLKCDLDGAVIVSECSGLFSENALFTMKSRLSLREFDFEKRGEPLSPYVEAVRDGMRRTCSDEFNSVVFNYFVYGNVSKFVKDGDSIVAFGKISDFSAINAAYYTVPFKFSLLLWNEESESYLPLEAHESGVGFTEVERNSVTGKYRLCVSDPSLFGGRKMYIEFNEDGTLSAQTGAQGTPGRDGRDGKDGVSIARVEQTKASVDDGGENVMTMYDSDGKDIGEFTVKNGSDGITPEISVSATVDGGTGEPSVTVRKSGTSAAPDFALEFSNLRGKDGAEVEAAGIFGLHIDGQGDLILSYSGDSPPALSINGDGELVYTY